MASVVKSELPAGNSSVRPAGRMARPKPEPIPEGRYAPGEKIADKYVLVRPLEQGGMGTVWVAHNTVLDVKVGIKLINLGYGQAEEMAERLLSEARSAARLDHAAIVRIHDFGRTRRGDPFLVMELLDGENLGQLLEREHRLAPKHVIQLLLPIAHALSTAHDNGIVHRDVKPDNVFLAKDSEVGLQPKLLDFGIARINDSPRNLTMAGALLGTPAYMSPEQARGEPVDAASDVFSFSVMLYEALAGDVPFYGENYHQLLRAIIGDEAPNLAEQALIEPRLWTILEQGLHKQKAQRWPSLRAMGEALAMWLMDQGTAEDITGTSLHRSWFRDPESNSWSDISQLTSATALRALALGVPESVVTTEVAPPSSQNRESLLQALVEMSAEGDPLELVVRSQRRRSIALFALFFFGVAVLCVGLLASLDLLIA